MQRRKRSTPHTFQDQIEAEKARLEAQLNALPMGPERAALLKKLGQLETALHMNAWLTSPGLKSPA